MAKNPDTKSSSLLDRANLIARGAAIMVAGIVHTNFPPIVISQALTKRFRREELLQRLHFMPLWGYVVSRWILGAHVDVVGQENLPRPSKGHMYISNHQSYMDIFVLMHALKTAAFLSKKVPVKYIPFVGRGAYCGGTVYVDREDKESRARALEETLRMCEESVAVIVFPEGTRSEDGELREKIYPRAIEAAYERGLNVVPAGLYGTYRAIPKAMDRVRTGERVAVRIGAVLHSDDYGSPEEYATTCWNAVGELHQQAKASID